MTHVLIAHQGGWDEILLVAVPVAIFALLLRMASRRAGRLADQVEQQRTADAAATPSAEPEPGRTGDI